MKMTRAFIAAVMVTTLFSGVLLTACGAPAQAPPSTPPAQETSSQDGDSSQPPAEPEPETPPETPPLEVDWGKVEIYSVYECEDSDLYTSELTPEYWISYNYPLPGDPFYHGSVHIQKSDYSPEAVRAAIEQQILEELAEIAEEERLKREIEEAL